MKVQRNSGFQFALVKEILDANAQKQQVEEKIRAAEEWQKLVVDNAARSDIDAYLDSQMQSATKGQAQCLRSAALAAFRECRCFGGFI